MSGSFLGTEVLNYAALAVPAFFIFLGLEYVFARRKRLDVFNFDDSVSNITVGIAERLLNLFLTATFYNIFEWIYLTWRIWDIPNLWFVWVILILVTDFVWYWYHRLGHEVNIMWAAHVVHHQSETYNYTVSARITTLQAIVRNIFWCILPLIGFHPAMVIAILIVHGTYSFFTHTQVIGKLGWLEHVLITPSHHRVHHASNEQYLNKNYGDIFVFWDKIFGTFQEEAETPSYGLTHPLKSYSFMWQHFHYFVELFYAARKVQGLYRKFGVILGRPEDIDQSIRLIAERKLIPRKAATTTRTRFRIYLVLQVIGVVTTLFVMTLFSHQIGPLENFVASIFILITLINCGALLQQRRWIYYLEYLRIFIITSYISFHADSLMGFFAMSMVIILSAASDILRKGYLKLVYGISS